MIGQADLQAVLGRFLPPYLKHHTLAPRLRQVCEHLRLCRTAALGGLQLRCDHCGAQPPQYHACRDRHCPKCQRRASEVWCQKQKEAVLPVTYFHVVFTLPHLLNPWVQCHGQVIYRLLFESVWATLSAFAANPKHLGGQLGMTAVLHTWGQSLAQHVHLHCLIPGGALTAEGNWRAAKGNYLFPKRALSRRFRGCMVSALRAAYRRGELHRLTDPVEVDALLDELMRTDWVVYPKPCVNHTERVVEYLARYSHRIAISDARIDRVDDQHVAFHYTDYRDGNRDKVMALEGEEFLRRFLLHVLPKGLMRIRHYGFLANRCRKTKLAQIRSALAHMVPQTDCAETDDEAAGVFDGYRCPQCRIGRLRVIGFMAPPRLEGG